jgi:hypothetical protein
MCGPWAKAMWGKGGPEDVETSGFSQRVSSWFAEPILGAMLAPAGKVTPAISTSQVVVRPIDRSGGSKRRASSMAWGSRERSSRTAAS